MKTLVIGTNSLRRLIRDRSNIFFVFLMPLLLILVMGTAFGGTYQPQVGLLDEGSGALAQGLADHLGDLAGLETVEFVSRDELIVAVERGTIDAGLIISGDFDQLLRAGETAPVEFISRPDQDALALRNTLESAITVYGLPIRAASFAAENTGADFSEAFAEAEALAERASGVSVEQEAVGEPFAFDQMGRFDLGAYSQLLLFIFITSTTGSTALIQSRQLGVSRRMLSTPTSVGTILAGELLGRLMVALFQGALIIGGTALLFGVEWGDPLGVAAVFLLFALVSAGVGMLMGATFRNDQQAGGIGVVVGLGFAALGGAMVPLTVMEMFSPALYRAAHITPHAWGISAFEELIMHGGTVADIGVQLLVLAAFAAITIVAGTVLLRKSLTR